jgi:hypothetical protein
MNHCALCGHQLVGYDLHYIDTLGLMHCPSGAYHVPTFH